MLTKTTENDCQFCLCHCCVRVLFLPWDLSSPNDLQYGHKMLFQPTFCHKNVISRTQSVFHKYRTACIFLLSIQSLSLALYHIFFPETKDNSIRHLSDFWLSRTSLFSLVQLDTLKAVISKFVKYLYLKST